MYTECAGCKSWISVPSQIYSGDVEDDFVDEIHLSSSQLQYFAREAQVIGDYQLAVQYYQEVRKLCHDDGWCEYQTYLSLLSYLIVFM